MSKSKHGHYRRKSFTEGEAEDVKWKEHEQALSEIFFRPQDFIQRY